MSKVRTRFAPSPTGFLHLGSARTALFNWAFARHHGGELCLRIEDTDLERSTSESEAAIVEGLAWLGFDWDGAIFRQSEHRIRHAELVEQLVEKGHAYRCTCSAEEIEARRQAAIAAGRNWVYDGRCRDAKHGPDCGPHVVRLRLPAEGRFEWDDLVFGPSGKDAAEIGDAIIRRSDGTPLYHLAVVVDDLDMGITHVIRGADHHLNTALQLALYDALERPPPRFAHLPLIVNAEGKKLSKRRDPVSVQDFRDQGYLPEALCNWLARIGWSHGDQEIFSMQEIRDHFDLAGVHRSAGQADPGKLAWLNQHWIKTLPGDALFERARPFFEAEAGRPVALDASLARLIELLRERSKTLVEMARLARFLLVDEVVSDEAAVRKHLRPEILPALEDLAARLAALPAWDEASLAGAFEAACAAAGGLAMGKLAQPVRVAVTGSAVSPGIHETLAVLGRERSLARIGAALERLRAG